MCSVMSDSLQPHGLQLAWILCLWNSPGKNAGVGCHFFLQGIFLTQQLNPHLLCWQANSLPLHHLGSPPTKNSIYIFVYMYILGKEEGKMVILQSLKNCRNRIPESLRFMFSVYQTLLHCFLCNDFYSCHAFAHLCYVDFFKLPNFWEKWQFILVLIYILINTNEVENQFTL